MKALNMDQEIKELMIQEREIHSSILARIVNLIRTAKYDRTFKGCTRGKHGEYYLEFFDGKILISKEGKASIRFGQERRWYGVPIDYATYSLVVELYGPPPTNVKELFKV